MLFFVFFSGAASRGDTGDVTSRVRRATRRGRTSVGLCAACVCVCGCVHDGGRDGRVMSSYLLRVYLVAANACEHVAMAGGKLSQRLRSLLRATCTRAPS